jgi:hypothetical protein
VKSLCAVLLILAMQAPLALGAQQQTPGSVEGIAVIAGSDDPVRGAVVELRRNDANPSMEPLFAAVQSDGRFLFRSVTPGRYQLLGTRNGYLPAALGQKSPGSPGVPVVIAPGQQVAALRLSMTPTATITGRIMDRSGEAIPGVVVQLLKPMFQDGRRTMAVMKSMVTNDLGEYRMFWVTPGSYYVNVIPPPDTPNAGGINIVMNPTAQPAGRSLWSNQSPVATRPVGSGLLESEAYLPIFFPGTADENAATPVELQAGAEVRSIDIRVTPVRAFRVRGRVLNGNTGQPLPGAGVQLISVAPGSTRLHQSSADAMGIFVIPRVPAGPYVLASIVNNQGIGGLIDIEIRDSDIEETLDLQPFYTITGRVTAANPAALQVRMRLDYPIPNAPQMNAAPAADGSFTLRSIPPGDYRVYVQPILLPQGLTPPSVPTTLQSSYVKSMALGGIDLLNGRLRLDRAPEAQIEIQVATDPGSVNGRVLNSRQTPVAAATVVVMPDVERRLFRTDLFKVTTTNESGQFLLEGLPPGDYRVFAWENVADRAWQDPGFMRAYEEMGKSVRISENAQQSVDIMIIP